MPFQKGNKFGGTRGAKKPIAERLMAKVSKEPSGCWIFHGAKSRAKNGYGIISRSRSKPAYAHRVAYEEFVGEIPAGLYVLLECDTPCCVNPAHLFIGSAKENWEDSRRKGRNFPTPQETPNYRYLNHYLASKVGAI